MQKSIALKNIEYSIHEKPILRGVSFKCGMYERLCLFGENGAGKSTLLKMLCGKVIPDSGVVHKEGHVRFAYVSQEFGKEHSEFTIEKYIEEAAGIQFKKKSFEISKKLGFNLETNKNKLCGLLSGGQQKIMALATAFALNPDYLLLDEPENHIDIVSRAVLIEMLKDYKGGIIFISHDRMIIDSIATKIGELANGELHISSGGYDDYIQTKMERLGGLQRQYDAETKRIRQLSQALIVLQQKAFRGKDVAQYRHRRDELEDIKRARKQNARPEDRETKIKITQRESALHKGKLLIRITDASFAYKQHEYIFEDTCLEIRSGSKLVLLGRNGTGKSTFLKCLIGEHVVSAGEIAVAQDIKVAYFDQHADLSPEETALNIIEDKLHMGNSDARSALGAMKFDIDRMKSLVKNLSGGERMRLRFAIAFGQKPDLLILDEPTNHIDEVTWEILLEACDSFKSTILLVSHDYEFIENFKPDMYWMIKGKKVVERHKDLQVLLEEMGAPSHG